MFEEEVGGAVELHVGHGLEIEFEQLSEGAYFLQPTMGGEFAAGCGHAADNIAKRGCFLAAGEADFVEDVG